MLRQAYPALTLRELTGDETLVYYALVDRNRGHLTSHGDYRDMLTATVESVALDLRERDDDLVFGGGLYHKLIGASIWLGKDAKNFVLGTGSTAATRAMATRPSRARRSSRTPDC